MRAIRVCFCRLDALTVVILSFRSRALSFLPYVHVSTLSTNHHILSLHEWFICDARAGTIEFTPELLPVGEASRGLELRERNSQRRT